MATGQFDIVLGAHDADVTAFNGGSIGSSGVRVIVDDTNCRKKEDAIQGINYILNRLKEGTWPPTIFSPLSLFAAGEQGAWYDPSDLATLFQDSAGTIPVTATGQPVGRMLDKSGRGNHATQSTAGSRPTFRDVGGLRYLEFDGTDDFLLTGNINLTATDKLSLFAGLRKLSNAAIGMFCEFSAVVTNPGTFYLRAPATTGALDTVSTTDGTNFATDSGPVVAAPNSDVASIVYNNAAAAGSQIAMRVGGISQAPNTGSTPAGNFGNFPLFIGRRGGTVQPFNGHFYGLTIRGALSDAATVASMEAYLANKTGITLP